MAGNISFEILGLDLLAARFAAAAPKIREEVASELYAFGWDVMNESLKRVPWKTGALAGTGDVRPPEHSGDEVKVTLGYGDDAVGYALYVHENMSTTVNWTRPGSGPKYLESPLKEMQDRLPGRIKDAVKRGFDAT